MNDRPESISKTQYVGSEHQDKYVEGAALTFALIGIGSLLPDKEFQLSNSTQLKESGERLKAVWESDTHDAQVKLQAAKDQGYSGAFSRRLNALKETPDVLESINLSNIGKGPLRTLNLGEPIHQTAELRQAVWEWNGLVKHANWERARLNPGVSQPLKESCAFLGAELFNEAIDPFLFPNVKTSLRTDIIDVFSMSMMVAPRLSPMGKALGIVGANFLARIGDAYEQNKLS